MLLFFVDNSAINPPPYWQRPVNPPRYRQWCYEPSAISILAMALWTLSDDARDYCEYTGGSSKRMGKRSWVLEKGNTSTSYPYGAMNFIRMLGIHFRISNSLTRRRCNFKGLSQMRDRLILLKTSAPHPLMPTYRMSLLSARSIPLDSIFKRHWEKIWRTLSTAHCLFLNQHLIF